MTMSQSPAQHNLLITCSFDLACAEPRDACAVACLCLSACAAMSGTCGTLQGTLFPMCGMNLAFDRQLIGPAMYFGLMGEGQPIGRYDDMWAGWCCKVGTLQLSSLVAPLRAPAFRICCCCGCICCMGQGAVCVEPCPRLAVPCQLLLRAKWCAAAALCPAFARPCDWHLVCVLPFLLLQPLASTGRQADMLTREPAQRAWWWSPTPH